MKLQYLYKICLLLGLIGLYSSCSSIDDEWEECAKDNGSIVLQFSLNPTTTSRAADEYEPGKPIIYETLVRQMDVYIFDSNKAFIRRDGYQNLTIDAEKPYTFKLNIKQDEFDANQQYTLVLVANTDVKAGSWVELHKAISAAIDNSNTQQGTGFLMSAQIDNVKLKNANGDAVVLSNIRLERACAKVRIHVKYGSKFNASLESDLTAKLVNYAQRGNLVKAGTGIDPATCELASTGFYKPLPILTTNDTCDVEMYCYPNDWNDDIHRETYVMLKRPIRVNGQYIENNYYKIPVNFRLPDDIDSTNPSDASHLYKIERNHLYDITVLIDKIGSTDDGNPVELQGSYAIKDWGTKEVIVDVEQFDWLWVKDRVLYMNNITQISTTFDSSAPDLKCVISDVTVYNQNTAWANGSTGITATATQTLSGTINITSPVPDNFSGKSFKVTVSSATSGKSETIQVHQFPSLYLTLQSNKYAVDAGSQQTNSSLYEIKALLANLSTLPSNDSDFELDEPFPSGYSHPGTLEERLANAKALVASLKKAKFGYPQTESLFFSSVTSTVYNSSEYFSNITANCTVESDENNQLISPHFILASQGGANSISDYTKAKNNCAGYYETIKKADGTEYTYASGTWRMPTKSELQLIDLLQNLQKSLVKKILEGHKYQYAKSLNGTYWNGMIDYRVSNNAGAVRCVRDIKE